MHRLLSYEKVVASLRINWIVGVGVMTLFLLSGLWLPNVWMPVLGFILSLVLMRVGVFIHGDNKVTCVILMRFASISVFVSALVMLAVNMLNTSWGMETFGIKEKIPFVTTLIFFPVATVCYAIALIIRGKVKYCRRCYDEAGITANEGMMRGVFHAEAKLQLTTFFFICLLVTIVSYWYYFKYFIEINYNRPDIFFFYAVPTALYFLSIFYFISRYASMHYELSTHISSHSNTLPKQETVVRYIIVKGDEMYLQEIEVPSLPDVRVWETPVTETIKHTPSISDEEAAEIFRTKSGCNDFKVRALFSTVNGSVNVLHYAVFLPPTASMPKLSGEWLNLYAIDALIKANSLSRPLAYEIHRIFNITMAWKTYDRQGNRLYPIKKYRPTFRLRDFKDWDVDYSDLHWMSVADLNADKPLFRLRRLWRRYFSDDDNKWRRSHS